MTTALISRSLETVRDLFDAAADDEAWRLSLQALGQTIGADQSLVYEVAADPSLRDPLNLCAGSDPLFARKLCEEFAAINPYRAPAVTSRMLSESRTFHGHELVSPIELRKSSFYNDFMRHHNDVFHSIGGAVQLLPGVVLRFGHGRNPSRPFSDEDRQAADIVAPHLLAAARLRRSLRRLDHCQTIQQGLLDVLADALVVVDEHGRPQLTNARADEMLAVGNVLSIGKSDLHVSNAMKHDLLADPVARIVAAARGNGGRTLECFAVDAKGHGPLFVTVSLLPTPVLPNGLRGGIHLAVFVREFVPTQPIMSEASLRATFGFTKAEARIADALLTGLSTRDIAARLEVRVDTVRQHVKQLLQKTGARRQSELLRIMVKATPNLRMDDERAV